jgi:multisubunit Na+/H+ antiporter MnhF subunit
MHLDVRLPIGLMFLVVGLIMSVYGAVSGPEIYKRCLGINLNLIWGACLAIFGGLMLLLAWRGYKKAAAEIQTAAGNKQSAQELQVADKKSR